MVDALQFISTPPDANLIYVGNYNPLWVIFSILLAILTSYAALNASSRIGHLPDTSSKLTWTLISAFTMGAGIWAMHFIGMFALDLPCRIYYDITLTLISMILGVLASGVALGVWRHDAKHLSTLLSSCLLGLGIGAMHYTGMAAMRFEGIVRYDPFLFALSLIVAIVLFYLALRLRMSMAGSTRLGNMLLAVIMGAAVSGMHYIAMYATYFVRGHAPPLLAEGVTIDTLAILIIITTFLLTLAALGFASVSHNLEVTNQLRDSEERWKFALEGSGDGVWDWNPKTDNALFSKRWKEMLGYAEHEFSDSGAAWIALIHPEDKENAVSIIEEYCASSLPFFVLEYRLRCKNGSWKWILARGKLVGRDVHGKPLRLIGTHTDISDRKRSEESLQRSESRFRSLFDTTGDAVMVLDEGGFFDCNKAALKIFGLATQKEFCLKHPADLSPPTQPCGRGSFEFFQQLIASALKKGSLRFEWIYKRQDTDESFPAEVLLSAMELEGKTAVQATVRDITERKQAEKELRIAATAFESQEGIVVTDVNNIILRVNYAFTRITGYSAEEVIGKKPSILHSGLQDARFYTKMWESIRRTGSWEGEIWNRRKNGELYPEYLTITAVKGPDDSVSNYVATLIDITLSKAAADEIERLAFYDPLTGLSNRRLLLDRLNHALASSYSSGRKGALLFIDLDNFKTLNDTLGHDMGDMLLQQVARRLELCVAEGNTVARLGGDEFVVMLEGLNAHELEAATETELIGEKILDTLNQPYLLGTHKHRCTPSIGAALFNAHDLSIDELMKQADIAMYQAKSSGRNTMRFFDPLMQESINARVQMEADLRQALTDKQFELFYQPQVCHDGQIIGAEVLIRWRHLARGLVSPSEFIPLTEEIGLILPIGVWLLKAACAQIKSWQAHEHTKHLLLAVNVSARQFHEADFVEQVTGIVRDMDINPNQLKLELTESVVLDDINDTIRKMNALREIGVRFSIDDFGTGYSSLSYLTQLPLDQLKIDRSFVHNIGLKSSDSVIVQTIIGMAENLGMEVIAEGVETEAQRAFLEQHGCLAYQGYLYSEPLPLAAFEALISSQDTA